MEVWQEAVGCVPAHIRISGRSFSKSRAGGGEMVGHLVYMIPQRASKAPDAMLENFLTPMSSSSWRNAFVPVIIAMKAQWVPLTPLEADFFFSLRSRTADARSSSTVMVVSQLMHASVMLTPFLRPDGPSAGTFWAPSLMFDSIMTPMIPSSPARS